MVGYLSAYNWDDDTTGVSQMVPWVDGRGASDAVPHTRDGAGCHTGSLWCARPLQHSTLHIKFLISLYTSVLRIFPLILFCQINYNLCWSLPKWICGYKNWRVKGQSWTSFHYPNLKMDIISAAIAGNLSALQVYIKSGEDVNSVDVVSWFVGM